jgi:hypothetical protein
MVNNLGFATCKYCGSEYRLFSISNRDMQGLVKAWKNKHEWKCQSRTPEQRLKWAKPYIGKGRLDSSIIIDLEHDGMKLP